MPRLDTVLQRGAFMFLDSMWTVWNRRYTLGLCWVNDIFTKHLAVQRYFRPRNTLSNPILSDRQANSRDGTPVGINTPDDDGPLPTRGVTPPITTSDGRTTPQLAHFTSSLQMITPSLDRIQRNPWVDLYPKRAQKVNDHALQKSSTLTFLSKDELSWSHHKGREVGKF